MSKLYSMDQMNWLSGKFEEDHFTPEQVNMLGEAGRLRLIKAVLEGRAEIKMLEKMEARNTYLHLISGGRTLTIPASSGKRTIAKAKDVFRWGIDGDFKNWGLDVPGIATPEIDVEVHEMVEDGKFADIYGSTGYDLDKLVMTQDQVVSFVETHKGWLRTEGRGTFFLLKGGNEFFVADVCVYSEGSLYAYVYRFSHGRVWHAGSRHRFVIPQQSAPIAD
ncbi:MAG: hypothetical protein ABL917_00885 [Parcubacteria group bacterium]